MRYTSIADIYSANQKIRENLLEAINGLAPAAATAMPDGEGWSIQHIVEHLWMVEFGTARICRRLLDAAKAEGKPSDGSFSLGPQFGERAAQIAVTRVEAPERVQPTGEVPIAESLERMEQSAADLDTMRADFEQFDLTGHKFPHPFFGELNAGEWLVMAGLHERRHTDQIARLAEKIRQ